MIFFSVSPVSYHASNLSQARAFLSTASPLCNSLSSIHRHYAVRGADSLLKTIKNASTGSFLELEAVVMVQCSDVQVGFHAFLYGCT